MCAFIHGQLTERTPLMLHPRLWKPWYLRPPDDRSWLRRWSRAGEIKVKETDWGSNGNLNGWRKQRQCFANQSVFPVAWESEYSAHGDCKRVHFRAAELGHASTVKKWLCFVLLLFWNFSVLSDKHGKWHVPHKLHSARFLYQNDTGYQNVCVVFSRGGAEEAAGRDQCGLTATRAGERAEQEDRSGTEDEWGAQVQVRLEDGTESSAW